MLLTKLSPHLVYKNGKVAMYKFLPCLLPYIGFYLSASFVGLDFDITEWSKEGRAFYVLLSSMASMGIGVLIVECEDV